LLIGGWTVAAGIQPMHFDAVMRTISDLAACDTPHRWQMTGAFVGVGLGDEPMQVYTIYAPQHHSRARCTRPRRSPTPTPTTNPPTGLFNQTRS
jgi:hypothetical protein